jgi:hypothetical protein
MASARQAGSAALALACGLIGSVCSFSFGFGVCSQQRTANYLLDAVAEPNNANDYAEAHSKS